MRGGRFVEAIRAGKPAIVVGVSPQPAMAERVARTGFDGVWFEMQHGATEVRDLHALMPIFSIHDATVVVRVPSNDAPVIGRMLDAGASAIICPDVRTPEAAMAFASACKYPPVGERGFGGSRAAIDDAYAGRAYSTTEQNATVMAIAQIESPLGLENVEAIVGTPGIDGIFPGLVDYYLLAHGEVLTCLSFLDERVREPLERIISVTHAAGKSIGLPAATAEEVPQLLEMGADWLLFGGEAGWIASGARNTMAVWNAAIGRAS